MALKTGGMAAASIAIPTPAFAADPLQSRFEDVQGVTSASLNRASPLLSKISNLERCTTSNRADFLFTSGPSLCNAPKAERWVSVRLWRGTGGENAKSLLQSFESKFAKEKDKPDGFRVYYGTVVNDELVSDFALVVNIVETRAQAEAINAKELALVKKKVIRADVTIVPIFSDSLLERYLGGCDDA